MQSSPKRSPLASIPGFEKNAVLQLIVASGTGFITYHLIRVILLVVGWDMSYFNTHFLPNISLQPLEVFNTKWWTIFMYGWTHYGFWELFSNMVWLYAFGSVVQTLVGYRQLIPLFVYSLIIGGLFYELSQLIPGVQAGYITGAQAGVTAFAVAAITLAPGYRFYLGPTFSIPIAVITIIFAALMIMNTNLQTPALMLVGGGALTGFVYVLLLQSGYQPGLWVYHMFDKLEHWATPDEKSIRGRRNIKRNEVMNTIDPKKSASQKRIDEILDKINQKGYEALTQEEKDTLLKASKDNNN